MMIRLLMLWSGMIGFLGAMAQASQTVDYTPSDENFANPERGFYKHTEVHSANYNLLNEATLAGYRTEQSITQILRVFYLEDYRTKPISEEYLNNMRKDFGTARRAGVKVIVRFAYTQSMNSPEDAAPQMVFTHIEQLKPVLRENADVIAVVQTGFVGAWGEWYYTETFAGYTPSDISAQNWEDRKNVVLGLLDALPKSRAVQIRTPGYKMRLFNEEPLTDEEAFSGSDISRIGHHNDCFVASSSDYGTYRDPEVEKPYLEQETRFLPMGGETCNLEPPYSDCDFATGELERFHWSYLNIDYNRTVLDHWADQGCFDEVTLKLGHRISLTQSTLTAESQPGGTVTVDMELINDGYSSPYNGRLVELVIKEVETGAEYVVATDEAPRRWPVKAAIDLSFTAGLPDDLPHGNYQFYLNLPDPYPALYGNPAYSIRLANEDIWNETLGYNDLGVTLAVSAEATSEPYSGDVFFKARTAQNTLEVEGSGVLLAGADASSNLLFWGRQPGYQRVIERAAPGEDFSVLAFLDGNLDFFKDLSAEAGIAYSYRYYLQQGNGRTAYSTEVTSTVTASAELPQIMVDGADDDWAAVQPVSSAAPDFSLRSYFDATRAFFALYGSVDNYQLYLNTDNLAETGDATEALLGMDYLIQDDSLFEFSDGAWTFTGEKAQAARETSLLEISLDHSLLASLEFNPRIQILGRLNDQSVLLTEPDGSPAIVVRMPPADLPTELAVGPSEDLPNAALIVSWEKCHFCEGYILERSEDGTNFTQVGEYNQRRTEVEDIGLTDQQEYYYRIKAFSTLNTTEYSEIVSAIVGYSPLSLAIPSSFSLYPNPTADFLHIQLEVDKMEVYNLQGKRLLWEEQGNQIDVRSLDQGLYILRAYTPNGISEVKFIKR